MILAIGFHSGDVLATQRLLRWIADLGGCFGHECILIADAATPWPDALLCQQLAAPSFQTVSLFTNPEPVQGWIPGSNSLFSTAAHYCQGRHWLWLEPDAVPLRFGWMDQLEKEYRECGKLFMGAFVYHSLPGWPNPYMEGVAVYPPNALQVMADFLRHDVSWTQSCAPVTVPHGVNTALIQHIWGEAGNPPVFAEIGVPGTATFGLGSLRKEAVIFHRTKGDSLIDLLRAKRGMAIPKHKIPTYSHGGDVGDLIYGLCAIKAAGGGNLALVPHAVREAFTAAKADRILPFLRLQPYIHYAEFHDAPLTPFGSNDKPDFVDVSLDKFRELQFHRRHHGQWENIAQTHLRLLGLPLEKANEPWLTVDEPTVIRGKPVVFHRSERYQNPTFPWKAILQKYRHRCVFVGSPSEHVAFQSFIGRVTYHPTPTILDLARVIAGCQLFVGNQAAPYSIAEGLHAPAILESAQWCPDCVFERPGLIVGRDQNVLLPNV